MDSDKTLLGSFTFILGVFIGIVVAAALSLTAKLLDPRDMEPPADEAALAIVDERIAPVGRIALLGDAELAAAAAAQAAPARVETVLSGAQVFNQSCYLCHAPPGVPGAPLIGDSAAWDARIAQGLAVLQDHVLNGYQGEAGVMPPKGGAVQLSDEEVLSAIDYMLEQLGQQ